MRTPTFVTLTTAECEKLLRRNHVGRLAFLREDRVDIEPIHYVFVEGWIFGRTGEGTKLVSVTQRPWVAFEVDEVRSLFDWRSVVVHGTIYFFPGEGAPIDREEYERALDLLRTLVPDTLKESDPTPSRTVVFGIHIDSLSGRAAESRGVRKSAAATRGT